MTLLALGQQTNEVHLYLLEHLCCLDQLQVYADLSALGTSCKMWVELLCLVVLPYQPDSSTWRSSKVGRGLATILHPHLIALGWYVATEVEQQKRRK